MNTIHQKSCLLLKVELQKNKTGCVIFFFHSCCLDSLGLPHDKPFTHLAISFPYLLVYHLVRITSTEIRQSDHQFQCLEVGRLSFTEHRKSWKTRCMRFVVCCKHATSSRPFASQTGVYFPRNNSKYLETVHSLCLSGIPRQMKEQNTTLSLPCRKFVIIENGSDENQNSSRTVKL